MRYTVDAASAKLRRDENLRAEAKIIKNDREADISYLLEETTGNEPTLRRYIANDTTAEALGVLLQQNPNGLLVFRDELVSLLENLDQEEHATQRGLYLTGWNGNSPYTFDRITRGLHLSIDAVCLSILGSSQPGRISQYLSRAIRGGRFDDGLIQRFGLLVWPDISREWRHVDRRPDRAAREAAYAVFKRLDQLDWRDIRAQRDRGSTGDEEGLPYLRLGIDAYDIFVAWRIELERRLRLGEMHPALESHLAKYRKLRADSARVSGIACVPKIILRLASGEITRERSDPAAQARNCPLRHLAQIRLELAKRHLDPGSNPGNIAADNEGRRHALQSLRARLLPCVPEGCP